MDTERVFSHQQKRSYLFLQDIKAVRFINIILLQYLNLVRVLLFLWACKFEL